MRVLFDTNVFIYREDNKIVNETIQVLMRIINKLNIRILIHPKSFEDIDRDKDEERKKIILSKLKSYNTLETPPDPQSDESFLEKIGPINKPNDLVDSFLIYSIFKDAVDFLITEDVGIHRKSRKFGISERILYIGDAINLFKKSLPKEKVPLPPALKATTMARINIDDEIFESLREDYHNFNQWFKLKAREGRKCWIYERTDNSLGAILIYKLEDEVINSIPELPKRKRLKIATMKVSHVGYKMGELLLKLSFELALNNDCIEIYLTHFTKENDYLVDLIEEFGFEKVSTIPWEKGDEDVFLKKLIVNKKELKSTEPLKISQHYYPNFYDGKEVNKFIIPIQPQYHDKLFTDFPGRQTTLNEHIGQFIIEGNTIKKAYLTHSSIKKIKPGDILLFYRSKDESAIVSIGVIENTFFNLSQKERVANLVGKRSVYSLFEIDEIVQSPTTIIFFNFHFHFKRFIAFGKLKEEGILLGPPQSITQISHKKYLKIKKWSGIDERFTIN